MIVSTVSAPITPGRSRVPARTRVPKGAHAQRTNTTHPARSIAAAQLSRATHKVIERRAVDAALGELAFSLKIPKSVKKVATAVKKAVTIKNVAKVAAVGAALVVAAPLAIGAAKVALPAAAKLVGGAAKVASSAAKGVAKGASSAAKAVLPKKLAQKAPGMVASKVIEATKGATYGPQMVSESESAPVYGPPMPSATELLRDAVAAKIEQATGVPVSTTTAAATTDAAAAAKRRPRKSTTSSTTAATATAEPVAAAAPVYGPPAPSYAQASTESASTDAVAPGNTTGLPAWLIPAGIGVAGLLFFVSQQGGSRVRSAA